MHPAVVSGIATRVLAVQLLASFLAVPEVFAKDRLTRPSSLLGE